MEKIIIKAFNVGKQEVQDHEVELDKNGELVFRAEDGSFFKMKGGLSGEELKFELGRYQKDNEGKVVISEEELEEEKVKKENSLEGLSQLVEIQKKEEEK